MSVNVVTLAQLTAEAQSIGVQLNYLVNLRIKQWAALVLNLGTAGLQASPYSMAPADAADLFNAANDLDKFRQVWNGLMFVAVGGSPGAGTPTAGNGYNFFTNPSKVWNLGY